MAQNQMYTQSAQIGPPTALEIEGEERLSAVRLKQLHGKLTLSLALATFSATFGGFFIFTYNMASMNAPKVFIVHFLNSSISRYAEPDELSLTTLWSGTVAIYALSSAVGALTASHIADNMGRRNGLFVCQSGSLLSSIFFSLAVPTNMFELLIVGRVLAGWSVGACGVVVPLYVAEISPINLRGMTGYANDMACAAGSVIGQLLGLDMVLGSERSWPTLLALVGTANVVSCAILPFCAESPSFLLLKRSDMAGAVLALQRLRASKHVSLELQQMQQEGKLHKQSGVIGSCRLLGTESLRLRVALLCAANAAQQLTGMNIVSSYSHGIFVSAGIPPNKAQFAALGAAVLQLVATCVMLPVVKTCGRRPLLLISTGGITLVCLFTTVCLVLSDAFSWMPYLSIASVLLMNVAFSIGLGSIPMFIGTELFAIGPRAPAMALANLVRNTATFLSMMIFPLMNLAVGGYAFLLPAAIGAATFVFLAFKLPETKDNYPPQVAENAEPA